MKCLKLTQKVKNIKNNYQNPLWHSFLSASAPLRRVYIKNTMRRTSDSFFGRFASRRALRRTPQTFFKTMCVCVYIYICMYVPWCRT
ncbi:hypothetical protein HanIR_Chr06g0295271 [Helianthus annuus]|nr:hypothetical protein HanIR_Chr06g0295271 [Helianthus annuus]